SFEESLSSPRCSWNNLPELFSALILLTSARVPTVGLSFEEIDGFIGLPPPVVPLIVPTSTRTTREDVLAWPRLWLPAILGQAFVSCPLPRPELHTYGSA